MQIDLVSEAIRFMVLGMGGVFIFLLLMIMVLKIQSKIFEKFTNDSKAVTAPIVSACGSITKDDDILAAVVSAAITEYKKHTKR